MIEGKGVQIGDLVGLARAVEGQWQTPPFVMGNIFLGAAHPTTLLLQKIHFLSLDIPYCPISYFVGPEMFTHFHNLSISSPRSYTLLKPLKKMREVMILKKSINCQGFSAHHGFWTSAAAIKATFTDIESAVTFCARATVNTDVYHPVNLIHTQIFTTLSSWLNIA